MADNGKTLLLPSNAGQNNTFIDVEEGGVYNNNPQAHTVINTVINTEKRPKAYRITEIINCLAERADKMLEDDDFDLDLYYIDQKVLHNSLSSWADYIAEFRPYYGMINSIYAEFDKQGYNKSQKVLRWLKDKYRRLKPSYTGDELFDKLLDDVYQEVSGDHHVANELREEDLKYHTRIVLVDAFIKCEIFEKPKSEC